MSENKKLSVEVQKKISGFYVKGTILDNRYLSNGLIHVADNKRSFGLNEIEQALEELTELKDLMVAAETITKLSKN